MKSLLRIFKPSRKLFIILAGILLVNGGAGGAAYYFGVIGGHGETRIANHPNGLACTDVNLITIKRPDRVWIRKYIRTETTDGETRVKTALRVARSIYAAQKQKPDLVQVVVLDKNGPTLRSEMRGRAVGADVVYAPHPDDVLRSIGQNTYAARYFEGDPATDGLFFGERIELPEEKVEALNASLTEATDCVDPVTVASTGKGGEHGSGKAKNSGAEADQGSAEAAHGASADKSTSAEKGEAHGGSEASGHDTEEKPPEGGVHAASVSGSEVPAEEEPAHH